MSFSTFCHSSADKAFRERFVFQNFWASKSWQDSSSVSNFFVTTYFYLVRWNNENEKIEKWKYINFCYYCWWRSSRFVINVFEPTCFNNITTHTNETLWVSLVQRQMAEYRAVIYIPVCGKSTHSCKQLTKLYIETWHSRFEKFSFLPTSPLTICYWKTLRTVYFKTLLKFSFSYVMFLRVPKR